MKIQRNYPNGLVEVFSYFVRHLPTVLGLLIFLCFWATRCMVTNEKNDVYRPRYMSIDLTHIWRLLISIN